MVSKTEIMAIEWLKKNKGYKEKDIRFFPNRTPDFVCRDKMRYEVKRVYGENLLFSERQIKDIRGNDSILVFDDAGFKEQFKWKNRYNSFYRIKIVKYKDGMTCIKLDLNNRKWLESLKNQFKLKSLDEVISRLIKVIRKFKLDKELKIIKETEDAKELEIKQ